MTFMKVVKYWDEFQGGGDGAKVLKENGKGITKEIDASAASEV